MDRGRCASWQILCILMVPILAFVLGLRFALQRCCGHLLRQLHQRNDVAVSLKPAAAAAARCTQSFRPRCCSDSSPCRCGSSISLMGIFVSESDSCCGSLLDQLTFVSPHGQDVAASVMPAVVAAAQRFVHLLAFAGSLALLPLAAGSRLSFLFLLAAGVSFLLPAGWFAGSGFSFFSCCRAPTQEPAFAGIPCASSHEVCLWWVCGIFPLLVPTLRCLLSSFASLNVDITRATDLMIVVESVRSLLFVIILTLLVTGRFSR